MKIDRVSLLTPAALSGCDFSFEVTEELVPPYENPFQHVAAVSPYCKKYELVESDFILEEAYDDRLLLAAGEADRLQGYILASKSWNNYVQIDDFAVDRSARHLGIGRALMNVVVAWTRKENLPGIRLETQSNNVAACRFYYRYGFRLGGFDRQLYTVLKKERPEIALYWYLFLE